MLKQFEHAHDLPPPPEKIRARLLPQLEALRLDWRTEVPLQLQEQRFRREIVRWIMADPRQATSARRSLPPGYVVHAWMPENPARLVVVRTR